MARSHGQAAHPGDSKETHHHVDKKPRQPRGASAPASLIDAERNAAAQKAFIDPSVTAEFRKEEMARFAASVKYWDELNMGGPGDEGRRRAHAKSAADSGDRTVMQMLNDRRLDAHILLSPAQVVRETQVRARNGWETAERDNFAGQVATFKNFTVEWAGTSYLQTDPLKAAQQAAEMGDEASGPQGPATASIKTTMFYPIKSVGELSPVGQREARAALKQAGLDPERSYGDIRVHHTFINTPRAQYAEYILDASGRDSSRVQMGGIIASVSDEAALAYADRCAVGNPHRFSKPMVFDDPNYLRRTYPDLDLAAAKAHAPRVADVIRSTDNTYTPEEQARAMGQAKAGLTAYLAGHEPLSKANVRARGLDDWASKALGEPTFAERNQARRYADEMNKPADQRNPNIRAPKPRTPGGTVSINAQGEFKPAGRTGLIAGSDRSLASSAITRVVRRDVKHVIRPTPEEQATIDRASAEARRQSAARREQVRAARRAGIDDDILAPRRQNEASRAGVASSRLAPHDTRDEPEGRSTGSRLRTFQREPLPGADHAELATKADIAALKGVIADLRVATQADLAELESRLRTAIQADVAGLRAELGTVRWAVGLIAAFLLVIGLRVFGLI